MGEKEVEKEEMEGGRREEEGEGGQRREGRRVEERGELL